MKLGLIRIFTCLSLSFAMLFLLLYKPKTSKPEFQKQEASTNVVVKVKIDSGKGNKATEDLETERFTEVAIGDDIMPEIEIKYPLTMRRRNIESSFEVKVKTDSKGNYILSFPDTVELAFINAVENAFKGKISDYPNIEFILPVEFKLY